MHGEPLYDDPACRPCCGTMDSMAVELAESEETPAPTSRRTAVWAGVVASVLIALVAVGLVVTRTGDDADVATEDPTLVGAAGSTVDAETARFSIRSGERDEVELEGIMSFGPQGRALISLNLEVNGIIDPSAEHGEMRAFPDRTYISFDGAWISFTNEDFTEENGFRFDSQQNPFLAMVSLFVESLDHAVPGTIETISRETSHGEPVTVISARFDFEAAVRAISIVDDEQSMTELFDQFGSDLTVMLDDAGRARGVALTGGAEDTYVEFWDFGVPLEVEVPPTSSEWSDNDLTQAPAGTRRTEVDVNEDFCPFVADDAGTVTTDDRDATSAQWARSTARMYRLAQTAPAELVKLTTDLEDIYGAITDALTEGVTFDDVIADGVQTDLGLLDWRTITTIEDQVLSAHALICP